MLTLVEVIVRVLRLPPILLKLVTLQINFSLLRRRFNNTPPRIHKHTKTNTTQVDK